LGERKISFEGIAMAAEPGIVRWAAGDLAKAFERQKHVYFWTGGTLEDAKAIIGPLDSISQRFPP
jgi:hypothetical protein